MCDCRIEFIKWKIIDGYPPYWISDLMCKIWTQSLWLRCQVQVNVNPLLWRRSILLEVKFQLTITMTSKKFPRVPKSALLHNLAVQQVRGRHGNGRNGSMDDRHLFNSYFSGIQRSKKIAELLVQTTTVHLPTWSRSDHTSLFSSHMEYSSIRLKVTKGLQRKCLVHMPQKLKKSRHSCHSRIRRSLVAGKPWPFDPPTPSNHQDTVTLILRCRETWGHLDTSSKSLACSTGASGQLPATGSQDHISRTERLPNVANTQLIFDDLVCVSITWRLKNYAVIPRNSGFCWLIRFSNRFFDGSHGILFHDLPMKHGDFS